MPPLSNAERQARYYQRLRRRASLDGLGDQARMAAEQAMKALWFFNLRQWAAGNRSEDFEGCDSVEEWRKRLATRPSKLVEYCRNLNEADGLTVDEAASCRVVVEAYDALTLASQVPKDP